MRKQKAVPKSGDLKRQLSDACLMFGAKITYFNLHDSEQDIAEMSADMFYMIAQTRAAGASEGVVVCPSCGDITIKFTLLDQQKTV